MKKNISINISGIIFHIEEDGYETLKKYLDSINRYFASFEDSAEILADIEGRIAEIFLSKLNEGKQVITLEDVNALMTTMGSVKDFKAAEEQNSDSNENDTAGQQASSTAENPDAPESAPLPPITPNKLYRDQKRKILGGVCAGIAHYARIDAVWIRLVFVLLTPLYFINALAYIILWIIVPGSYELEEYVLDKKMFRDPETKTLGGVSGGLAAYFGLDLMLVRILFVLLSFAFLIGLFIYIILWVILPQARTVTEQVQMRGKPITLSNIESTVKKKELDEKTAGEENPVVKILLFPFRLIALILNGLAKVLKPIMEVIRVLIGIFISMTGLGFLISLVICWGVFFGLVASPWPGIINQPDIGFPVDMVLNIVPVWMTIASFIAVLIPCILIMLLGISIINKRGVISAPMGWSLFILFLLSLGALAVGVPQIILQFKEDGEYKTEQFFDINKKTVVLKVNEVGLDDYDVVDLILYGYDGKDIKVETTYQAQGTTRQQAITNAQMATYTVTQKDSILTFDSNIRFKEDAIFRAQRVDVVVYIPYNKTFVMASDFARSHFVRNYIDYYDANNQKWTMTTEGLQCITCPKREEEENKDDGPENLDNFEELEVSGIFDISIHHGDHYAVEFKDSDSEEGKYKLYKSGSTLVIEYEGEKSFNFSANPNGDEVRINITMPRLERLEAIGFGTIRIDEGMQETHDLDVQLTGPIILRGNINTTNLNLELTTRAEANLSGRAQDMTAEITSASTLKAYKLEVRNAAVEVNAASHAQVNVSGMLEINEGTSSEVDYRGTPEMLKKN